MVIHLDTYIKHNSNNIVKVVTAGKFHVMVGHDKAILTSKIHVRPRNLFSISKIKDT